MLYGSPDPQLLAALIRGEAGFTRPEAALEGLSGEQAAAKPHGLPHSIAEIVAHMLFYQDLVNNVTTGAPLMLPRHASEGWPAVAVDGWDSLRERFLAALRRGEELTGNAAALSRRLLPEGQEFFGFEKHTAGSLMADIAAHNAHHLGQVVTIRHLLGAWPPPQGGMTW
jgi:uncharacterized damage-inducible protein DinB